MSGGISLEKIKARVTEVGDCWEWPTVQRDIPCWRVTIDGKRVWIGVRRWLAESMGRKVEGKCVTNSCQNKACVNPDHIQLLTKKQIQVRTGKRMSASLTIQDSIRRSLIREKQGTKITREIAREIRASDRPTKEWAAELGCSQCAVRNVRSGRTFKDFQNPFAGLIAANDGKRRAA